MSKVLTIILIFVTLFAIILYFFTFNQQSNNQQSKKPIFIEPIKIESFQMKNKSKETPPSDILLKFKKASNQSKENFQVSQEEIAQKVLETLKNKTAQQEDKVASMPQVKPIKQTKQKPNIQRHKIVKAKIKKIEPLMPKKVIRKQVPKQSTTLSRKEEVNTNLPDAYYFETQEVLEETSMPNEPLQYVKKLGVVEVSDAYEVNFSIPN